MKAKLLPLSGKYYNTKIELIDNDLSTEIELNIRGNREPSIREIRKFGDFSRKDYENNIQIRDSEAGDFVGLKNLIHQSISDDHYETKDTYDFCTKLLKIINNYKGN
ncbi:MAG: hypothetical protein ACOCVF_03665 [bacterium]